MKIAIGNDHRGFAVKRKIVQLLKDRSHEVIDIGTDSEDGVDYPDYAMKVGEMVADGSVERGILICGTGIGMALAANKIRGVRAAPVHDDVTAELSRLHNDSNVLCLSADLLGQKLIDHIVEIWVNTPFEGGRHARRIKKIEELESKLPKSGS